MIKTKTTVDLMIEAAMADEWPEDIETLRTFMFDRCKSEEELINLFGLYIGLIKLNDNFDKAEFEGAVKEKRIADYIIQTHLGMSSHYLNWFKSNLERFLL